MIKNKVAAMLLLSSITVPLTTGNISYVNSTKGGSVNKKNNDEMLYAENIPNHDLNVDINTANIKITKIVPSNVVAPGGEEIDSTYSSSTQVPATGNIATTGVTYNFSIPVQFMSKLELKYNIKNFNVKFEPEVQFMGKGPITQREKEAIENFKNNISFSDTINGSNLSQQLSSTGTIALEASMTLNSALYNVKVIPKIVISGEYGDGHTFTKEVSLKDILVTNGYLDNISASGSEENNQLKVSVNNSFDINNKDIYNPSMNKPTSLTIKLLNLDSKYKFTAIKSPDLIKNSNGTYTIKGRLLQEVLNDNGNGAALFNIGGDAKQDSFVFIEPINETFQGFDNSSNTLTIQNFTGQVRVTPPITSNKGGVEFPNIKITSTDFSQNSNLATEYNASIPSNLKAKFNVYTGSLIQYGGAIYQSNTENTYVHLNQHDFNIMLNGTKEEKAELFKEIISGNLRNGSCTVNRVSNEEGKTPLINFVYTVGQDSNNKTISVGDIYEKFQTNASNDGKSGMPVVSRTITMGILDNSNTEAEIKANEEQFKNDPEALKNSKGEINGFIKSAPAKISNIECPPYITTSASGSMGSATILYKVNIDNINTGINSEGSPSSTNKTVNEGWLNESHKITIIPSVIGSWTSGYTLEKGFKLKVSLGENFEVNSPVEIDGEVIPSNDYKVEGNDLIITMPKTMNISNSSLPITFGIKYEEQNNNLLKISAAPVNTPENSNLQVYEINNNLYNSNEVSQNEIYSDKVNINVIHNQVSYCEHYAGSVDKNNDVTLTDVVYNSGNHSHQFVISGEIPTSGMNTLPGTAGYYGNGNLESTFESISPSSLTSNGQAVPMYVLPIADLKDNSINKQILESNDPSALANIKSYLSNPANGWVKYKPGMSLKGMAGYVALPVIGAGQDYTMHYGVKLTDVNSAVFQNVNSAFKYYDLTYGIGALSPVVTLSPNGESLSHDWISTVVRANGIPLTKADLDQTTTYNGKTYSLKSLIGHGPDNDQMFDLTPQSLMNEVTFAENGLGKLGYKLDYITVNGVQRNLNWFENVGIINNTTLTKVKFVISKATDNEGSIKVEVINQNGKVLSSQESKGKVGSADTLKAPKIPTGYHLEKITNGTGVEVTGLPEKYTDKKQEVIYHVVPDAPTKTNIIVKVVGTNNEPVKGASEPEHITGEPGSKAILKTPTIPAGYKIDRITENGSDIKGLPSTFGKNNETIIYHISKMTTQNISQEVEVVGHDGKVINIIEPSTVIAKGYEGEKEIINPYGYNKEKYTLQSVVINGTVYSPDDYKQYLPKAIGAKDENIVYRLTQNTGKVHVETVIKGSKTIVEGSIQNLSGDVGTTVEGMKADIKPGYTLKNILLNGKEVSQNVLKNLDYENETQKVTYVIGKLPTSTISQSVNVVNSEGKIIETIEPSKVIASGYEGEGENIKPYSYNKEKYTLKSVSINGKTYTAKEFESELPKEITENAQHIIYNLVKNTGSVHVQTIINGSTTPIQGSIQDLTGNVGTEVEGMKADVKPGYTLQKILLNGKEITQKDLNNLEYNNGKQKVTYVIEKLPTSTISQSVNVVNDKGQVIETLEPLKVIAKGYEGEKESIKPYSYNKEKYTLKSVTIDGKTYTAKEFESELPKGITNKAQNIVYNLVKNTGGVHVETVIEGSKTPIEGSEENLTGDVGTKVQGIKADIKPGYTLKKILLNGQEVSQKVLSNLDYNNGKQKVTYIISKLPTNSINQSVNVVNDKGQVIETLEPLKVIAKGYEGEKEDIKPYSYNKEKYTLKSVIINGKTYTAKEFESELPKGITKNTQSIVYNLVKNTGSVHVETIIDGSKTQITGSVQDLTGDVGSEVKGIKADIKPGYTLKKILLNGKETTQKDLNDLDYNNGKQKITYIISKLPTNIISQGVNVVNKEGKIIKTLEPLKVIAKGYEGEKEDIKPYSYNKEKYTLKSVIINGKTFTAKEFESELPKGITKNAQSIVYNLVKNTGSVHVETVIEGNKSPISGSIQELNGDVGTEVEGIKADIKPGYTLQKILLNGKEISQKVLNHLDYNDKTQKVTYVIGKLPVNTISQSVNVVNKEDKVIETLEPLKVIAKGYEGESENIKPYSYNKEKYTLKSVSINGKTYTAKEFESELPKGITKNAQSIVYNLVKNTGLVHVETIIEGLKTPINGSVQDLTGNVGTEVKGIKADIKPGYTLQKILLNGKEITQKDLNNLDYNNGTQKVTYVIGKLPTSTISQSVNIVDSEGKIIETLEPLKVIAKGYEGESENIKPYSYNKEKYTLKSVVIDGKIYTAKEFESELPKGITKNAQSIVYNLVKNIGSVHVETIINGSKVPVEGSVQNLTGNVGAGVQGIKADIKPGYTLKKILINGKEATQKVVNELHYNNGTQKVTYVIGKLSTSTISQSVNVVNSEGKVIETLEPSTIIASGYKGETENIKSYSYNKKKYTLKSVIINGKTYTAKEFESELPKEITDKAQSIVYNLVKNTGKVHVETIVEGSTTPVAGSVESLTGNVGNLVKGIKPKVTPGYTISKILLNGHEVTSKKLEGLDYDNGTQKVTYIINKIPDRTISQVVNVVDNDGKVIKVLEPSTIIAKGYEGENETVKPYSYNKEKYTLQSVTINGKTYSAKDFENNLPKTIGKNNEKIVYNLKEITGTAKVIVVEPNGKIETHSITGEIGTNIPGITVPKGDKISQITVNGHNVSENEVPKSVVEGNTTIIYHLVPEEVKGSVKVEVVGPHGVISSNTTTGKVGTKIEVPTIPNGDHITKITVNGNETPKGNVPKTIVKGNTTIIYNVAPKETPVKPEVKGTVKVEVVGPHGVISSNTTTGKVGTKIEVPTIPNGDHITKITVNGNETPEGNVPKTIVKGNTTIIYNVAPKETPVKPEVKGTVKVEVVGPHEVISSNTTTGKVGTRIEVPTIPNGDHITKITVNGNETPEGNVPKTIVKGNTTIIYHVTQDKKRDNNPKGGNSQNGNTPSTNNSGDKGNVTPNSGTNSNPKNHSEITPSSGEGNQVPINHSKPVTNKTITINGSNGPLKNMPIIVNGRQVTTNTKGQITIPMKSDSDLVNIKANGYNSGDVNINNNQVNLLPHTGLSEGMIAVEQEAGNALELLVGAMAAVSGIVGIKKFKKNKKKK